jgi:general secretion pathway protein I
VRRARAQGGFTLVEVLLALGILFAALVFCLSGSLADVNATNRAKLMTVATGLASSKMLDLEAELYKEGFSEFAEEQNGDFGDEGFPRYAWEARIEKVTLPSLGDVQTAVGDATKKATEAKTGQTQPQDSSKPSNGAGASALMGQFEVISKLMETALRKITLTVTWRAGNRDESLTVVCYFADLKAVESQTAMLGAAISGAGGPGGPGGGQPPPGGGPGGGQPPPGGGGKPGGK